RLLFKPDRANVAASCPDDSAVGRFGYYDLTGLLRRDLFVQIRAQRLTDAEWPVCRIDGYQPRVSIAITRLNGAQPVIYPTEFCGAHRNVLLPNSRRCHLVYPTPRRSVLVVVNLVRWILLKLERCLPVFFETADTFEQVVAIRLHHVCLPGQKF